MTNIPAHQMLAGEVTASCHDLWHVEQSSRMSKTGLRARPIFHHQRDTIEAHLTVVIAALAAAPDLQQQTGMSITKIVWTLRPLQQITVQIAGYEHLATDPIPPPAADVLHSLGIPPTDVPRWHKSGQSGSNFLVRSHVHDMFTEPPAGKDSARPTSSQACTTASEIR